MRFLRLVVLVLMMALVMVVIVALMVVVGALLAGGLTHGRSLDLRQVEIHELDLLGTTLAPRIHRAQLRFSVSEKIKTN